MLGIPEKVTQQYLESIGYKSKNDRPITSVLKFIGVLESNGSPTPAYTKLRNKQTAPQELAELIAKAYSDVFDTYPNAHKKDEDTLKTWFASHTSVGEASIKNMTKTFTCLCSVADFNVLAQEPVDDSHDRESAVSSTPKRRKQKVVETQVAFNVQIQIPADQPPDVYESIFKNLGRYVLGVVEDE